MEAIKQDRSIVIGGYTFDEKQHLHLLDGKPLTGVTTVLSVIAKPALIQWSANEAIKFIKEKWGDNGLTADQLFEVLDEAKYAHRRKKEDAGAKGTEVHAEIEKYINHCISTGDLTGNWDKSKQTAKFAEWAIENNVKFLAAEKHLYSRTMWTGGICDFICEIDGKRYVGDVKTSSGIYPEMFIQASAYVAMLKEMGEEDFDGVVIVNCDKKGGFDVKFNYDLEGNLTCFKAALTLYRHLNAINPRI